MSNKRNSQDSQDNSALLGLLTQIFGSSPLGRLIAGVILVIILLAGGGVFLSGQNSGGSGGSGNTAPTAAPVDNNPGNSNSGSGSSAPGLPAQSYKQTAKEITFHDCPPEGDGGDPVLNQNKNRVDDGKYQPTAFSAIANLTWPKATERTDHAKWSKADQAEVAKAEGLPVLVEGYLALARAEGPETPNCHSKDDIDFHIWMLANPGGSADRGTGAVVIEMTPRVRANHPGWTVGALNKIAKAGTRIRVSGWLMLDPEHPDQVGNTRATIWEIHPVMQVEVQQGGKWVKLDDYN